MEKTNVKFEDVVYFQEGPGVRNWQFRDSGIKLINIRNLVDSELCLENTTNYLEIEEVENKYKHFLLNEGDFVMASSGVTWGKIAEVHEEHLPLCLNTSIIRLVSKDTEVLDKWYLYYYIKSPQFRRQIEKLITGSAQPNFGPSHLKKVFINLPEICNQRDAVEQFSKVEAIINKRQKEVQLLDNLIKARFVELFGDRFVNDKMWNTEKLGNCMRFNNGKAHEQVVDEEGEYILITSRAIASDLKDVRRTNALLFPLRRNDIVMVMSDVPNGRALAKCLLIDSDDKYTLNQRICSFDNYEFNPIFLVNLLNRHQYFLDFNDGNGQTNLRKNDILECELIIPPMTLQEQFAAFVEQVDKSKVAAQKALDTANTLMASLMQQYFG